MFELADSGSSGGLSLRLSISLSFSFVLFSSSPPGVSLSPPLPFHLLCDAVPCCVGTGVRDRVASDRAPHTLSSVSSVSSVSSLPPLRPFSSTFPRLVSVSLFLSLFLSLYSMHHRPDSCLSRRTSRPIARGRRGSRSPLPQGAFMILPIRSVAPAAGVYCHAQ